jgi:hypothetical protein
MIRRSADAADEVNSMRLNVTMLVFGLVAAISRLHAGHHFCGFFWEETTERKFKID